MKRLFVSVHKSPKKAGMYIYRERKATMENLPETLGQVFGEPIHVLDLVLTEEKQLARVEASDVFEAIERQGFFLQMPPPDDESDVAGQVSMRPDSLHG